MTFTEIRTEIAERLNYTNPDTLTRIGRLINKVYRQITTSIGISASRYTNVSKVVSIGNAEVTFTGVEKIFSVWTIDGAANPTILTEVMIQELREEAAASSDEPKRWALKSTASNSVTIRLDAVPATAYALYADVIAEAGDLAGSDEPNFSESFHDIIIEGVLKDEYKKLEKVALARESEGVYERRLSDLRMFIAKSNYMDIKQGKIQDISNRLGTGGGTVSFGTTALTITALWTFSRGASAPFAVAAGAAYVANLLAAGVGNVTSDRLLGRDTGGAGTHEEITVGGGLEFTGALAIQRSALTGDITASAGSNATTLAANVVTFAKFQQITTDRLLGRDTTGTGNVEELSVTNGLEFTGGPAIGIANDGITDARLRNSGACSVVGRSANSAGDPADISAGSNDQFLRRRSDVVGFGSILTTDVPAPGSDTQVVFNDATALGADAGLTYNKNTDTLTVAGPLNLSGAAAGQIAFPASQNASGSANTLDDYEEGSWTPTITSAGGGSMTYTTQFGAYTKIGRLVFCTFSIVTASDTLSAGSLSIAGLPFTAATMTLPGGGVVTSWTGLGAAVTQIRIEVATGATTAALNYLNAGSSASIPFTDVEIDGSSTLTGIITYHAAN